ncbi:MAG: TetR/AcrR family transcriptional regulator [Betaproteobacteria bacterium]
MPRTRQTPRPRRYRSAVRQAAMAETVRRIVAATVELHAEQGSLATSHAQIAERAGVAVPTVYKHFPTRAALLPHCMGLVEQAAPPLDEAALLGAPSEQRVERLVEAVYRRHAHFAPWLRWSAIDAPRFPELAAAMQDRQRTDERLALAVLAPLFGAAPAPPTKALVMLLLGFAGWQQLHAALGGDNPAAMRAASAALRQLIPAEKRNHE